MTGENKGNHVWGVSATDAATDILRTVLERSPPTRYVVAHCEDGLLKATWCRLLPCSLACDLHASLRPSQMLAVSVVWAAG